MYSFIFPQRLFAICHMYVFLIFKSTKDVNLKIKSIAKSCILDSYKEVLWKFVIYTWIGEITPSERYTYYVICRKS